MEASSALARECHPPKCLSPQPPSGLPDLCLCWEGRGSHLRRGATQKGSLRGFSRHCCFLAFSPEIGTFILPDPAFWLPGLCSYQIEEGGWACHGVHPGAIFSPLEQCKSPRWWWQMEPCLGESTPGQAAAGVMACGFQAHQELRPLPPCQGAETCPLPSARGFGRPEG